MSTPPDLSLLGFEWHWSAERVVVAVLALLLLLQSLRLLWFRGAAARRIAKHHELGKDAESRAKKLLQRSGYRVLKTQATGRYELVIDGVPKNIIVFSDFIVEKNGSIYVAEVKSGSDSAKLTGRATRRQLLEYTIAFSVDGVLLVDMHDERISLVLFPSSSTASRRRTTR